MTFRDIFYNLRKPGPMLCRLYLDDTLEKGGFVFSRAHTNRASTMLLLALNVLQPRTRPEVPLVVKRGDLTIHDDGLASTASNTHRRTLSTQDHVWPGLMNLFSLELLQRYTIVQDTAYLWDNQPTETDARTSSSGWSNHPRNTNLGRRLNEFRRSGRSPGIEPSLLITGSSTRPS